MISNAARLIAYKSEEDDTKIKFLKLSLEYDKSNKDVRRQLAQLYMKNEKYI